MASADRAIASAGTGFRIRFAVRALAGNAKAWPDGHLLEIITRPYGSGGSTADKPHPLLGA